MRDPARVMPDLGVHLGVRELRVWHCKYKTLQPIGVLRELRTLVIGSYPDADFDAFAQLRKLRYLRVLHLPKVTDLSALAGLESLETLSLETTPGWDASGKRTIVESLEPLAGLPRLRHVQLFGVLPESRSLAALERCAALVSVRVSKYPKAEQRRFLETTGLSDAFAPGSPFGG